MLGLLRLNEYAAQRGEGLRPEFLQLFRKTPGTGVAPLSRPVELPRLINGGKNARDANSDGKGQSPLRRDQVLDQRKDLRKRMA